MTETRKTTMTDGETDFPPCGAVREDTVRELTDMRCRGMSFGRIAERYGCSKTAVYLYYRRASVQGFCGYEPHSLGKLRAELDEGELTFAEIALLRGMTVRGLRNYLDDRNVKYRHLPCGPAGEGQEKEISRIRGMLSDGRSGAYIARYYGVSYLTLKHSLRRLGIPTPGEGA